MKKSEIKNLNSLTLNQIIESNWCTIGGRVEDYAKILKSKNGFKKCFNSVNKDYKEDAIEVFVGVYVFVNYGADVYYKGVVALEISAETMRLKNKLNQAALDGTIPDAENPLFIFQMTSDKLLVDIIKNNIDIKQLALVEAYSRNLSI